MENVTSSQIKTALKWQAAKSLAFLTLQGVGLGLLLCLALPLSIPSAIFLSAAGISLVSGATYKLYKSNKQLAHLLRIEENLVQTNDNPLTVEKQSALQFEKENNEVNLPVISPFDSDKPLLLQYIQQQEAKANESIANAITEDRTITIEKFASPPLLFGG